MNTPPRRVLVTGGSGYLGTLAVAALAERGVEHVVVLDLHLPTVRHPAAVYVTGDIRTVDLAGLCRDHAVGAVVHLAAVVEPPRGMTDRTLREIEIGGTHRVLDACRVTGVRHVTVTSSGAAYGYRATNRGRLLAEDDPVPGSARFAYSRHKAEVESLLLEYRAAHPDIGQLVLRPGTILGEHTNNQITALFTRSVVIDLLGADVPFVFIWDADVAEVIARGVTAGTTGVYNLAGDGVVTLADIAAIEGARRLPLPPALLTGALAVLHRLRLTRYGPEQVDFLRYRPVLANERLKQTFPGLPRKTSREAYDAFRLGRAASGRRG